MATLYRLVIGGLLVQSQRWSIGFSFDNDFSGNPSQADVSTLAQQLYADWLSAAWNTSAAGASAIRTNVGAGGNVDSARLYLYAPGQRGAIAVGASTGASSAGTGAQIQAPQVCQVVSLLTPNPGRSGRGRIYLPLLPTSISGGVMANGIAGSVATSIANYLSLARTRSFGGSVLRPVVAGATNDVWPITAVRSDNVADTQRRRRDKIAATQVATVNLVIP